MPSSEEIKKRADAVPGDWSIEEHGDGFALYAGRSNERHGLNLVYLKEPDFRWAQVKAFLENAHKDVLWLLEENAHLRLVTQTLAADLRAMGELCGMTDDEHPLKAVIRLTTEHARLRRERSDQLSGMKMREDTMSDLWITKGTRVAVHFFQVADPPASLAGNMLKFGATEFKFEGTVRHVRGDAPTVELSKDIKIFVQPDDPVPDGLRTVACEKCGVREIALNSKQLSWMKMSERAKLRSPDYNQLTSEEQWAEDKRLGILDWDGSPEK